MVNIHMYCLFCYLADLIMLGLATHEVNFTIIREEFKPNQPKPCDICGQHGKFKTWYEYSKYSLAKNYCQSLLQHS